MLIPIMGLAMVEVVSTGAFVTTVYTVSVKANIIRGKL